MLYCSSSYQDKETLENVHQIRYSIRAINQALAYAEKRRDKTIIIEIPSLENLPLYRLSLELLLSIAEENENVRFDIYRLQDLEELIARGIGKRCYFHDPITTWNFLAILSAMDICGITLGDPLCFQMDKIERFNKSTRVEPMEIRLNPTLASNYYWQKYMGDGPNQFWILPQDIRMVENAVQVLDLLDNNVEREKELIKIYTVQKDFDLPLKLLVPTVNSNINGHWVNDHWSNMRLNCAHDCVRRTCSMCMVQNQLFEAQAKRLKEEH